jgi:hypothetical protein
VIVERRVFVRVKHVEDEARDGLRRRVVVEAVQFERVRVAARVPFEPDANLKGHALDSL